MALVHRSGEDRELGGHLLLLGTTGCFEPQAQPDLLRERAEGQLLVSQAPFILPGGPLSGRGLPDGRAAKGSSGEITTHLKIFVFPVTFGAQKLYKLGPGSPDQITMKKVRGHRNNGPLSCFSFNQ